MQLAEYGPKILVHTHIQKLFGDIMRTAGADADPDEINWNLVNENWDLPFADKVKPRADNPVTQEQLDEIKAGKYKVMDTPPRGGAFEKATNPVFCRNIEDLNKAQPGLGDEVKRLLDKNNSKGKIMSKKTRTSVEQMQLIEVGPENLKEIAKEVRIYKRHQFDRLSAGKKEVSQRDKIRIMVKKAGLKRLQDGTIKFEADNAIICIEPQEDLITIKEKKTKKTKKSMKKKVETEETKFEGGE